jgi:DNA-binding PadR family transcriptional regulator
MARLAFEIQELPDIIRIVVLLNLSKGTTLQKPALKHRIDKVCTGYLCVDMSDVDKALNEMASEGLIHLDDGMVHLTDQGIRLGKEWRSLLLKKEPIIEVVAGLVDGSITGLVVILSAFIAGLGVRTATFAALLTLGAVAITNFSSFLLGGITEDLADMLTLQNLMNYSLSDIPDKKERDKSLKLVKDLFTVLHGEISRSNIIAAVVCGGTTFLAGIIPIVAYLWLPKPYDIILSLAIVATVVGVFLVRYRSRRTKVHWKVTLFETVAIVVLAALASLLIGGTA